MRAAIYSRFSTDRQSESSIEDQVRICEEYARQEAMTVCERFADHGISGASIGNRPGYMKLRESLLGRRFDVVLVSDLSRLSRSTGDLNKEIDRFVARGIRVVGVQDGYDSARKGHKLQAGLGARHPCGRRTRRVRQRAEGPQIAGRSVGDYWRGLPRDGQGPDLRCPRRPRPICPSYRRKMLWVSQWDGCRERGRDCSGDF